MWVSRKQWREMQDTVAGLKADASGRDKDLFAMGQRIKALEDQVLPVKPLFTWWITSTADGLVGRTEPPAPTLLQKVNLLFDHLKLRVQPEGTTPATIVKTKGAK